MFAITITNTYALAWSREREREWLAPSSTYSYLLHFSLEAPTKLLLPLPSLGKGEETKLRDLLSPEANLKGLPPKIDMDMDHIKKR